LNRLLRVPLASALNVALVVTLAGCALQPHYQPPQIVTAGAWQARRPHNGSTAQLVDWWQRFDDATVAELIRLAESDSPTLAQAAAAIESARASLASAGGSSWPSVSGSASLTREKQVLTSGAGASATGADGLSTSRNGGLDASWEIDLFGKLRSKRDSAHAQLQASIDDWHDARVSLAAEVADDYVQYRACRLLRQAYGDQAASQRQTARATQVAVSSGLTARSDAYLAEAGAATAAASTLAQDVLCEELVKSLVALTGADEAALRALIDRDAPALPEPAGFSVDGVPADLLRQRPDLASAERMLASAYAQVGEARADRFPSLSLGGSITVSASNLVTPATSWSFGPSLSVPLFDGGQRKAAVDSARASYEQQLAGYRGAVRSAVREVEQALVDLYGAARRSEDATRAAEQYRLYAVAIDANWHAGLASLLTLEDARRSAISSELILIGLQRDRVRYWIALYKALGGGWQADAALASTSNAVVNSGGTAP
jgi:NodT family efflux transporter outer membrane factor (OMF) lipoprotein